MTYRPFSIVVLMLGLLLLPSQQARSEEVAKKFRFGFTIGGFNTQDEVPSDSANVLLLVDERDIVHSIYADPRNDSAALGDLRIEPAPRATVSLSYAINRFVLVEGSVGYQQGDVGDIEVQAQFSAEQSDITEDELFRFRIYRFKAGEMKQVPIQLTSYVRFRPKANLNPYVGGGVGYTLVGFSPSGELDRLSTRLDRSVGAQAVLQPFPAAGFGVPAELNDIEGATVDARDTFAWHLAGGLEYGIRKQLAAVLDLRYVFASRAMHIRFNGEESLGVSVPQSRDQIGSDLANALYGPYYIPTGGLVDGGQLVPDPGAPEGTDCGVTPLLCHFETTPDGVLDPGFYYVQGGRIRYGGVSLQIGIRYTF